MSLLDQVVSGRVEKPPKLLIWGPPAVGKSTFASAAPDALFIEAEDRTGHLDVTRFEVTDWKSVLGVMGEVAKGGTPYKTLVFDTIDAIEMYLLNFIADEAGCESHEDIGGGFAKFRAPMLRQWKRFMTGVDMLTKKGIQCILLGHAKTKQYQDPNGPTYDRFVLKMDQAGGDFIIENMDLVGYAKFQTFVRKEDTRDKTEKAKATTTGKRLIQFKFSPAIPTKQGVPCEDEVELSWEAFQNGLH